MSRQNSKFAGPATGQKTGKLHLLKTMHGANEITGHSEIKNNNTELSFRGKYFTYLTCNAREYLEMAAAYLPFEKSSFPFFLFSADC